MTPIYKSGEKYEPGNYRPISILPCFSKLLERIMHNRLYKYLQKNDLLYQKQFGFQSKHSTEHALLEFTNFIYKSFENSEKILSVFIDLSKAFDTVNHAILLEKLKFYGINGITLEWFKNYLLDRKQYISFPGQFTGYENVLCGVPQGSILGPLLFLLYINDLKNASVLLNFIIFADDTNLSFAHQNIEHLFQAMNTELNAVCNWFMANKLSVNPKKTTYMIFYKNHCFRNQTTILPDLFINEIKINRVTHTKFLGINFDEKLSWKRHITSIESTLSRNLGIIRRVRQFLSHKCLKQLYFALLQPHISYGNLVWGSTNKTKLSSIFKRQKYAMKLINFKTKYASSTPLFTEMGVLNIYQQNLFQTVQFMFKVKHKITPKIFQTSFNQNSHKYKTRSTEFDFTRVKSNSKLVAFRIADRGTKLWNFLPPNVKSIQSLKTFKKRVKKVILNCDEKCLFQFF